MQDNSKGKRADLRGSDLSGSNLRGSNLSGSDLNNTKLNNTIFTRNDQVQFFSYNMFIANHYNGVITIGCLTHSVDHWIKNYKEIGKKNGFTDLEIEMYGLFILIVSKGEK